MMNETHDLHILGLKTGNFHKGGSLFFNPKCLNSKKVNPYDVQCIFTIL